MSTYKFQFINKATPADGALVDAIMLTVEYDDEGGATHIESVINVFVQFLSGVTYPRDLISKYIKTSLTE